MERTGNASAESCKAKKNRNSDMHKKRKNLKDVKLRNAKAKKLIRNANEKKCNVQKCKS